MKQYVTHPVTHTLPSIQIVAANLIVSDTCHTWFEYLSPVPKYCRQRSSQTHHVWIRTNAEKGRHFSCGMYLPWSSLWIKHRFFRSHFQVGKGYKCFHLRNIAPAWHVAPTEVTTTLYQDWCLSSDNLVMHQLRWLTNRASHPVHARTHPWPTRQIASIPSYRRTLRGVRRRVPS